MVSISSISQTAALIGDLARASMLAALMDGRALTATELAHIAGIAPQTASGHLNRMADAGLVARERQGRHRYHRLASPAVARMIESIMSVAADLDTASVSSRPPVPVTGPRDKALRYARSCYDHLAGQLAVEMTDSLIEFGRIELSSDGGALTEEGHRFLRSLGVDLDAARHRASSRGTRRVFCRPCLDWSERRLHIGGALGAAMYQCYLDNGWIRRAAGSRAVTVTPHGQQAIRDAFALTRPVFPSDLK
ncbi:ArsR/SmtB family transcription factor [Pollutimonas bauzanensis]|uniref:Transcriptional regulator, ArsR family n=1 Tax=Pollutimonas bauzanensis TaxID=658167 RepID=A0A1M5LY07_9BURK|nr:winged helix-turn-helix domain-containing protein [Pollutimonas bauzanensis]SHG69982.1 transcriptional regulator, ArsR family [Pollutimonas bauzanensis]